jgi:hypothetical protein
MYCLLLSRRSLAEHFLDTGTIFIDIIIIIVVFTLFQRFIQQSLQLALAFLQLNISSLGFFGFLIQLLLQTLHSLLKLFVNLQQIILRINSFVFGKL